MGDYLIVGVSSDYLNFSKKQRYPVYPETERLEIIRSLKFVDEVFIEESLELKGEYIKKFKADILVMGDDWLGDLMNIRNYVKYHICQELLVFQRQN